MLTLPGPIAVIDFETTGLFPGGHDRVVEVAAVFVQPNGRIGGEFASLVNPERDIGPTRIHGLTSGEILHAPKFAEIAASLVDALKGTVAIAAHNVRFDRGFLQNEFSLLSLSLPEFASVCTMQLAGGRTLTAACEHYGVRFLGEKHQALSDARAAAQLFVSLLTERPSLIRDFSALEPIQWPTVPYPSKPPVTRIEAEPSVPTWVRHLLER